MELERHGAHLDDVVVILRLALGAPCYGCGSISCWERRWGLRPICAAACSVPRRRSADVGYPIVRGRSGLPRRSELLHGDECAHERPLKPTHRLALQQLRSIASYQLRHAHHAWYSRAADAFNTTAV